jgi:hypothetical protein
MDSSDGRYGWAADDPRWTDAQAGGRGRLEPPPQPMPSFSGADHAADVDGPLPSPLPRRPAPQDAVTESLPAWRPAQLSPGAASVRPGYGMTSTPGSPAPRHRNGVAVPSGSRLERPVQAKGRRRADDEFRAAGRAELFSDDARYGVLFAVTAAWYAPIALIVLVWVLLINAGNGPAGGRLLSGLAWIAVATAISIGVASLLRWARVGWRALTLSVAAALIGGGVATIAHTLSG